VAPELASQEVPEPDRRELEADAPRGGPEGAAARPAPDVLIAESADVAADARLGASTRIWHLAQVREGASIGRNGVVGRGAYVGCGVRIGDNCKIQNYALVYEPAELGDGVFIGPAAVLTNDQYPRAVSVDGTAKSSAEWQAVGVVVGEGASIGARAVCVAPVRIGRWAMVAAGAVVTRPVPDFALVAGVPAKRIGWVGRAGHRLTEQGNGHWVCPATGARFREVQGELANAAHAGAQLAHRSRELGAAEGTESRSADGTRTSTEPRLVEVSE
jgi:acetyltransferase-like isoleucine patch superfamily enzyme